MTGFADRLPEDNETARCWLYRGRLFRLPRVAETTRLVAEINEEIDAELGRPARTAHERFADDELFARIGRLRKRFYTERRFHAAVCDVIAALGFDPAEHAFDPIRLRVVAHRGHDNPAARAIYYGHRDTWYSNPQAMITWWIPLHAITVAESFEFFPDEFERPVANDSEVFDFDAWVEHGQTKRIGWQDKNTGSTAAYPQLLEPARGARLPVECEAGGIVLFSGQHLHGTKANTTGLTRWSLDFRTVHLGDHDAGIEAPNVDNRSAGSSLRQFVRGKELVR